MKKLAWIVTIAWWLYFLTAIFLYIHYGFKWVNTADVLFGFALLIAFSVWFVIDKFRSEPGKSRWVFGWNGQLYRRKSHECWGSGYPGRFRRFANDEPERNLRKTSS